MYQTKLRTGDKLVRGSNEIMTVTDDEVMLITQDQPVSEPLFPKETTFDFRFSTQFAIDWNRKLQSLPKDVNDNPTVAFDTGRNMLDVDTGHLRVSPRHAVPTVGERGLEFPHSQSLNSLDPHTMVMLADSGRTSPLFGGDITTIQREVLHRTEFSLSFRHEDIEQGRFVHPDPQSNLWVCLWQYRANGFAGPTVGIYIMNGILRLRGLTPDARSHNWLWRDSEMVRSDIEYRFEVELRISRENPRLALRVNDTAVYDNTELPTWAAGTGNGQITLGNYQSLPTSTGTVIYGQRIFVETEVRS